MRPPKNSQSDLTMSASSDGSPIRRPRPHSVAGRLPSYASPTVSSKIRISRDTEKKSSPGNLTVCYRFSKFMLSHVYFSPSFHFITPPLPLILSTRFSQRPSIVSLDFAPPPPLFCYTFVSLFASSCYTFS